MLQKLISTSSFGTINYYRDEKKEEKKKEISLYEEFTTADEQEIANTDCFVIDGSYFKHAVSWRKNRIQAYLDVCNAYMNYLQKNFKI